MLLREEHSFPVHPSREVVRAGDMEAIEERSRIDRRRTGVVTASDRRRELADVAADERRVESQLLRSDDRVFRDEILSERVERLRERARSPFGVGVRPEEREHLVA